MVRLKKLLKPYENAGAFHMLLAPHRFLDEFAFLTKSNQLGMVLHVDGMDDETVAETTLEWITKRVATAWRGFDERFRIYQYALKHEQKALKPTAEYPDCTTRTTDQDRLDFLNRRGLYSVRLVYVLLLETPPASALRNCLSTKKLLRVMGDELEQNRAVLMNQVQSFQRSLADVLPVRVVGKQAAFTFFRLLANLDPEVAGSEPLKHDSHVDYFMPSLAVYCEEDGVRVGFTDLEVLSMKDPPSATFPSVFRDLLNIKANFILCSEFKRVCQTAAVSTIRSAQNHWYWSQWVSDPAAIFSMVLNRGNRDSVIADKSAMKEVEALDETLSRVNNGGEYLGQFSFTVLLYSNRGRRELQTAVADVVKIFGNHEGSVIRENYNALNAYLAVIPGNHAFNLRHTWLLSGNYVDLSFLYAPDSGQKHNRHSGGHHLVVLETNQSTPYFFNIWEDDRLGALLFGAPGSGKSVLANLMIDHSQKASPRTFILDLGGSYRQITEKHNGSYLQMDLAEGHQSFRINPFVLPGSKENIHFLFSFVRLLLTSGGCDPSAADDAELFEAIESMYILGAEQRKLRTLAGGLPKRLSGYLRSWIKDGPYGSVFDNTHDTLTFSRFQVFDFLGMDELYPKVLEPLLFYIFHRISQVVYDPDLIEVPKQLWADEVWRFLSNDTARQYLVTAGKTWRKHNGGIGLITQSTADFENAGILEIVREICPKTLLLASNGADLPTYRRIFNLNPRELELFAELIPKQQFLEKTAGHSKVLNVHLDPTARWLYANSPRENAARRAAIRDHGFEEGLRRLAAAG